MRDSDAAAKPIKLMVVLLCEYSALYVQTRFFVLPFSSR